MDNSVFNIFLAGHIISGMIGFIVAPIALIVKKGSAAHKKWGKVFFYAMTGVATTAIVMAPVKQNFFLTCIAVFSYYLAFSGYRAVYRRRKTGGKPVFVDWLFVVLDLLFSVGLIAFGFMALAKSSFALVPITFGALGILLAYNDIRLFTRPKTKHDWLFAHMIGMVASYISAVTAFSVVNLHLEGVPGWIMWLYPTIIGMPLLWRYMRNYKKKLSPVKQTAESVG